MRARFLICFRDRIVNRAASAQADRSWGSGRVKAGRKAEAEDNADSVSETKTTTTDTRYCLKKAVLNVFVLTRGTGNKVTAQDR